MNHQMDIQRPDTKPAYSLAASKKSKNPVLIYRLLIIILVFAVVGVYFWQHHKVNQLKTKDSNYQSMLVKDLKIALHNSQSHENAGTTLSVSSASQALNTFYTKYIGAVNTSSSDSTAKAKQIVENYGTANLLSYAYPSSGGYSANPILCAQDVPSSFNVSSVSVKSGIATGTIVEAFGSTNFNVKATVIAQDGALKVNSVTCSPALTPTTTPN